MKVTISRVIMCFVLLSVVVFSGCSRSIIAQSELDRGMFVRVKTKDGYVHARYAETKRNTLNMHGGAVMVDKNMIVEVTTVPRKYVAVKIVGLVVGLGLGTIILMGL